jgi:hypothetical protein
MSPAWLILAVAIAALIVLGLIGAFVADRRRNEEVAHDPERLDPDPTHVDPDPTDVDPDRWRRT